MEKEIRETGIAVIGSAPWGTHFCQFYQRKEDLLEILIPYFKAGLENNEFCMWITSEPLGVEEADTNLRKAVKNLDDYVKKGQIEILDFGQWYTKSGKFDADEVMAGWVEKEKQALERGFDGLRLTGNTFWLEHKDWRGFTEYEEMINDVIGNYKMLAICTYALDKCGATEVMDVVANHQFALVNREDRWEIIESSEHKKTEAALRESEETMRYIIKHDPNAIAVYDHNLHYIAVSDRYLRDYNVKEADIIGRHHYEVFPEMPQRWKDVHQRCLAGAIERNDDDYFERPDGSITYNRWECRPWYGADGEIGGMITYTEVTTERKKAEMALRESEERYRALFEYNPVSTLIVDNEAKIVMYNFAKEKSEGEGRLPNIGDVMYKDYAGKHQINMHEELMKCIRSGDKKEFPELKYQDQFLHIRISPFSGGAIITSIDITAMKKLHDQLRQAAKMEAIGTLAGGIAHDFNNIMAIVLGNAELALDNVAEWNPAKDFLKEIRTASLRAKDLTRQILAFSRHSIWNRQPVRISPIISDSLKFLRASIPTTVEIRQNISCERDVVLADPVQINQVLVNLCTNAAHAMRESGGVLEVGLGNVELDKRSVAPHESLNPGIYVKLSVRDTGHGIEPKIMDLIFDPYFTTKRVGEGSGLGLSVVHGIMKISDGAISVESEVGKGSLFEVLLPCIEGEEEAQAETTDQLLPTGTERILLVDDERGLVRAYTVELRGLGYAVLPCTSALEALELFKAKAGEIDLVITDLTMPEMTGEKLARELMKVRPDIPIILCTGYDVPVSAERTREMGVRASLMKPISKGDLANAIRKVLDGR